MSDKYFEKKAEEILSLLSFNMSTQYKPELIIALKEIARDQRHACANSVNGLTTDDDITNYIVHKIMNTDIQEKK